MLGTSVATLAIGLATPAQAQSLGGLLGQQARAPRPQASAPGATPVRSPTMQAALARQRATQTRIEQIRAFASAARAAAARGTVTDGLAPDGLDPTAAVRDAIAAVKAGDTERANQLLVSVRSANDPGGLATWDGAGLPSQTVVDGRTVVTIDQTQERAILSWNRFDVGAKTTLQFNQKSNGTAQPDWVAVNRVTNSTDPSLILGNVKADGTVVVLNRAGIIFGKGSQVNTHSLIASTLELGNALTPITTVQSRASTIADRNQYFLENGLFAPGNFTNGSPGTAGIPILLSGVIEDVATYAAEGDIVVDGGAQIASGAGGFLILAAPDIYSSGILRAVDGQVSLQAGRAVSFVQSTGAATSADPYVRGYILSNFDYNEQSGRVPLLPLPDGGRIVVDGLIESRRGYLSLGTDLLGSIEQNGLLSATTSVSRNGKIALSSGSITLHGSSDPARAGGIEIVADDNGETVPQGSPNEPAAFKNSQIQIDAPASLLQLDEPPLPRFVMGDNALIYAPGADVSVEMPDIAIGHGATIDVSGYKDVALPASRNSIEITPVKRNELRDTPNYRDVVLDGNFTLNGATLYVDPRISGVRDDGVAWIGSPLIEAGSLASQIGAGAREFLTKGGSVAFSAGQGFGDGNIDVPSVAPVRIASGATIDFSGGWVRYDAGTVRTSRLITDDGRVVDIADADPNDVYVGVVDGVQAAQPRFGVLRTYLNSAAQGLRYDAAYDEGRDAGSLRISAAAAAVDGNFYGNGFAGSRQARDGQRASLASPVESDTRLLQRTASEMPAGGLLSIETLGDALIYHGERGSANANPAELLLSDTMLSNAGLGALSLNIFGSVTFAGSDPVTLQAPDALRITGASNLTLAPGGALTVNVGRAIRFDGTVTAPSGTIEAITAGGTDAGPNGVPGEHGSAFRHGLYGAGDGDDLSIIYERDPGALNPFDITVTGTLSTAGLWVNDFAETSAPRGGAFSDGGSISLKTASFFAAIGDSLETATQAVDLSGSIHVSGTLDVMAGGYVTTGGALVLDGKGGNVSLVNDATYAAARFTERATNQPIRSDQPLGGGSQSVDFTPISGTTSQAAVLPQLVPTPRSTVDIAGATIKGFGFAGGGTFTLVAPDISFGSDDRAGATHIALDFFKDTGFGTLDASTYRSRIVDDIFTNERAGKSAFLETTRFAVGAGETLDLTQWVLPSIFTSDQAKALRQLGSGADLSLQPLLAPIKPAALWDQRAAHLVLGGLTELDVLAGGTITGAPEASLTVTKLYNGGTIALRAGTIVQRNDLNPNLIVAGLGVRDPELGGNGLADAFGGDTDAQGRFDENALNAAGIVDPASGRLLTNRELVSATGVERLIYFQGLLGLSEGIVLADGSVTDLSGIAVTNPRAPNRPNGAQIRVGRVLDGGSIRLSSGLVAPRGGVDVQSASTLTRADGASVDISGTSAVLDQALGLGNYAPYLEWSAAGTISALGGGSLGTTPIEAHGGTERAEGGTLEWLRPTVGADNLGDANYLSASVIADSGFDSLIARNALKLDGDFTLSLRKALMVVSQDPIIANNPIAGAEVTIDATAGTHAKIEAGYVRFASRAYSGNNLLNGDETDAEVGFLAGAQGIDMVGRIVFGKSIGSLGLATRGDLRLIGVPEVNGSTIPAASGALVTGGDLLIDARRTYATTGTGNLQALLEGSAGSKAPHDLVATGDHSITFGNSYFDPNATAPLSAGTHLRVLAAEIHQNGYLAAPLGLLELGSNTATNGALATREVTFGAGSVTTVSGAGLNIPYGTTTDQIEYYAPVGSLTPITRVPTGQLTLAAGTIAEDAGALIDGRGGGDVFAYEFQSGVGGSRDVLDRINRDPFSSNGFDPVTGQGHQYPDHRQVFALVPVAQASSIAPFDPQYSADYGSAGPVDLYGASAGLTVTLDGAPAGEYLLVPAKYAASVTGALRLVENTDSGAPIPGQSTTLLDGTVIVGGTFGYAGTGIAESTRRSFTVQSKESFSRYSQIQTTSGSETLIRNSDKNGVARPRLPLDAARVVLSPLAELRIAGTFDTRAAEGGQGGQFELLGSNIIIAAENDEATSGALTITAASLANLGADSLLIGGQRSDNADGTTGLTATARSIEVKAGVALDVPELLLMVGGAGSLLAIDDGATLRATGALGTRPATDYVATGGGSILRLAGSGERLIARSGSGASTIRIGAATIQGGALALDTSGSFAIADAAAISADAMAISGGAIRFDSSEQAAGQDGVIGAALEAKLAAADRLTVRSAGAIRFSAGMHRFNDLVLDTAAIAGTASSDDSAVTISADEVRLLNSQAAAGGCSVAGFCGAGGALTLSTSTLRFGANSVSASSFTGGVTLAASAGMYVEGKGAFLAGEGGLTLQTPFLADRAQAADPRDQKVRPEYTFLTNGDFTLAAAAGVPAGAPAGNAAPGARINIGTIDAPVASASLIGSQIRASAGIIDIQSSGDVVLKGATLSTPGYEKTFGDKVDPVVVSAGGGTINLVSKTGNLSADAASTLVTDNGVGSAGTLNLIAGNGAIALDARLNPGVTGARAGSFAFDSGTGTFDFGRFVADHGSLFGGDVAVRTGAGDLDLGAGQVLKAASVALTADGGRITIAGVIDTSGVDVTGMSADAARNAAVNGGDIALWGRNGVTLAATALLDTHTTGYADSDSRVASAGDVSMGIDSVDGAITIAQGARIDVGARRTQAELAAGETGGRLVPQEITDALTGNNVTVYRYAAPDIGGTVRLRAPVLGTGEDKVAVSLGGSIEGADSVQLEAFKRYDLDALADSGLYSGVSRAADGTILLDMAASSANAGRFNPFTENFELAQGGASMVRFIQNFDVTTVDGSSLAGVRLRPGTELVASGDVQTTSQWNLGAATFSPEQLDAAVAAGVLEALPQLSSGGETRYRVVSGQEGALLDRYATFLYRVDGSARGEAPVVTMRAGGDLVVNRSISDGFFTFRDLSDPAYVNNQLGGGGFSYQPAIQVQCGTSGFCSNIPGYQNSSQNPGARGTLTIALGSQAQQGDLVSSTGGIPSYAPLAIGGNGAAAGGEGQNSLGFAELFPLLDDDVAMHSSDLRLVAGADQRLSADPLHVDLAHGADMVVAGEYSYAMAVQASVDYAGALQFALTPGGGQRITFDVGNTFDQPQLQSGLNALRQDAYTQLNWGSGAGLPSDARTAALAYFAGRGYRFVGSAIAPTGVIAPLNEIVAFLQAFGPTYQAGLTSGRPGYAADRTAPTLSYGSANRAYVRSVVRSGDGSIAVKASRDVDVRGAADLANRDATVYRRLDGTTTGTPNYSQTTGVASVSFSAAAIYTAGVRVAEAAVRARIPGGDLVTIAPDSPYFTPTLDPVTYIPGPTSLPVNGVVLADKGGDVSLSAGRDVLGRRDVWSERFLGLGRPYTGGSGGTGGGAVNGTVGQSNQRWRSGSIGLDTEVGLLPGNFTSGVGALAGGDVTIEAGRDVTDLTVALTSSLSTAPIDAGATLLTFGNGNLALHAGRDILAGRFDIASGAASIRAERNIAAFGLEPVLPPLGQQAAPPQFARVRIADAVADISAGGALTLASVSALGVNTGPNENPNAAGFFSPAAGVRISANENAALAEPTIFRDDVLTIQYGLQRRYDSAVSSDGFIQVLPPTVEITSLAGQARLPSSVRQLLYPSPIGQLRLLSDGDITGLSIAMSDADPGLLAGAFVFERDSAPFQFPWVVPTTTDAERRAQHNRRGTHLGDEEPVRIYTNGSLNEAAIFLPKQSRVTANGDIVNLFFQGQNLLSSDITRVRAGGDIRGEIGAGALPYVESNNFILGGPGQLIVEAGRDLGPFVTSAELSQSVEGNAITYSFGGGIRTVGNDYNPWLTSEGANLQVRFGMAAGADYDALRETYLDPDNFAMLDGDLFEQVIDAFGNQRPDRTKPIYAPRLAQWLRDNQPETFTAIFGSVDFPDTAAGNAALAAAAYGRAGELYQAFVALDLLRQQDFLINDLYFNEIREVGNKQGPSFQQYIRGYRAVQTLFPTSLGYTDNLAPYTLDPATISQDHPLGEPVRNIVNGEPQKAERVATGSVDLRLATIQTFHGGDVTILGPGGDLIAGSVVRTADQPSRRETGFDVPNPANPQSSLIIQNGSLNYGASHSLIGSIPLGYEGLLTLGGGELRLFTDGDFILNQSRAFTQQGGDIVMWSSNGDLAAGQGPKSASNFPPVTVRFDENGYGEVDSVGSVSGAGIGTFKRSPDDPASDVILIAPVGTVDAGDAGVRASGNVVVAAARVANADNFKAVGDITGVPSQAATNAAVTPNAAREVQAQIREATRATHPAAERRSIITVDVLGPVSDGQCNVNASADDPDCQGQRRSQ